MGRARSTGDPSQQELLPEVYRTASTGRCAHLLDRVLTSQRTINKEQTDLGSCVRVVYIAGDTLRHQPMGANHMTVLQLLGPVGSRVLPWWLFIAGDTLHHQPMRTGHMTVLQLRGLMEFHVLQWCHPMLASTRRTSCCTRIITLYGTQKWIQARTKYLCRGILVRIHYSIIVIDTLMDTGKSEDPELKNGHFIHLHSCSNICNIIIHQKHSDEICITSDM